MQPGHPPLPEAVRGGDATLEAEREAPWGHCEVVLVAHRTRGATHKFFRDRRFEVVMRAGQPEAGTVLHTVRPSPQEIAASGWRYDLFLVEDRPVPGAPGRAVFSWRATDAPATPDPLAAALEEARAWLGARGWEPDPAGSTHYRKPRSRAAPLPSQHGAS